MDSKLNKQILFACSDFSTKGGIQRFNRNLVHAWADHGYFVDVVSYIDSAYDHQHKNHRNHSVHGAGGSKLDWFLHLRKLLKQKQYEAYVCGHINLATAFQTSLISAGVRSINDSLILHGIDTWNRIDFIKRTASSLFNNVMAVSKYTLDSYTSQTNGAKRNNLFIFPNTVNPELYSISPDHIIGSKTNNEVIRLLSVSRLSKSEREKGILHVIESLKSISHDHRIKYHIIGDGDDVEHLKKTVSMNSLDDVIVFTGSLSDEAMWDEFKRADIFILPSSKEGFGIVFLEAMYFGLPVIGAAEKGALDVIENGVNGLLVEFGNVQEISQAIITLARDPSLRHRLGKEGQARVSSTGKFGFNAFSKRACDMFIKGTHGGDYL